MKLVQELNERCLRILATLANSEHHNEGAKMARMHRTLWCKLDAANLKRAAEFYFSILDLNFSSEDWWCGEGNAAGGDSDRAAASYLPTQYAADLTRQTLMLAWTTARVDNPTACILFGMRPAVAAIVSRLGPQDIESIVSRHSPHLRVRWSKHPTLWRRLLEANTDDQVREVHGYALQLLGRSLLSSSSQRRRVFNSDELV